MAELGVAGFTELITATLQHLDPTLYDNVTLRRPSLDFLRSEQKSASGTKLQVDLLLGENDSTTITDDSGSYNPTVSTDLMGIAEFDWSNVIISHARVQFKKLQMNTGAQRRHDMARTHIDRMIYGHGTALVTALHARADLGEVLPGWFHSLDQLVSDATYDADPVGDASIPAFTVGGIDAGAQPLWQGHRIELPLDGNQTIRKAFRTVENEVHVSTSDMTQIDKILAGRDIFEEFVDSFDDKVIYDDSFDDGQAKFRQVRWGGIVVRLDPDCPPKRAYFIDSSTLYFRALNGLFMKSQGARDVPNTLDKVTPAASILSLGTSERRANAVLLRPDTAGGDA